MTRSTTTARTTVRVLLVVFLFGLFTLTAVRLLRPGDQEEGGGATAAGASGTGPGSTRVAPAVDGSETPPADPAKHSVRTAREATQPLPLPGDEGFGAQEPIDGDLPEVIRSRVRAVVPVGQSMVTGGHRLEDGSHEFAVITPKWMDMPGGQKLVEMEVDLIRLDAAGVKSAGLDTLVTGERKSEQNAEVWTPEELERTMEGVDRAALQSKPRVVTSPGSAARITVGTLQGQQLNLELEAVEMADGAFDLRSDLKRLE